MNWQWDGTRWVRLPTQLPIPDDSPHDGYAYGREDGTWMRVLKLHEATAKDAHTITGDGAATQFTVTHTLDTQDVVAQVWDETNDELVLTDLRAIDVNTVEVGFAVPPTAGQEYRVVVFG